MLPPILGANGAKPDPTDTAKIATQLQGLEQQRGITPEGKKDGSTQQQTPPAAQQKVAADQASATGSAVLNYPKGGPLADIPPPTAPKQLPPAFAAVQAANPTFTPQQVADELVRQEKARQPAIPNKPMVPNPGMAARIGASNPILAPTMAAAKATEIALGTNVTGLNPSASTPAPAPAAPPPAPVAPPAPLDGVPQPDWRTGVPFERSAPSTPDNLNLAKDPLDYTKPAAERAFTGMQEGEKARAATAEGKTAAPAGGARSGAPNWKEGAPMQFPHGTETVYKDGSGFYTIGPVSQMTGQPTKLHFQPSAEQAMTIQHGDDWMKPNPGAFGNLTDEDARKRGLPNALALQRNLIMTNRTLDQFPERGAVPNAPLAAIPPPPAAAQPTAPAATAAPAATPPAAVTPAPIVAPTTVAAPPPNVMNTPVAPGGVTTNSNPVQPVTVPGAPAAAPLNTLPAPVPGVNTNPGLNPNLNFPKPAATPFPIAPPPTGSAPAAPAAPVAAVPNGQPISGANTVGAPFTVATSPGSLSPSIDRQPTPPLTPELAAQRDQIRRAQTAANFGQHADTAKSANESMFQAGVAVGGMKPQPQGIVIGGNANNPGFGQGNAPTPVTPPTTGQVPMPTSKPLDSLPTPTSSLQSAAQPMQSAPPTAPALTGAVDPEEELRKKKLAGIK